MPQAASCVRPTDWLCPEVAGERSKAETSRMRASVQFLAAVLYFFLARSLASRGAAILVSDPLVPLVEQATLAFDARLWLCGIWPLAQSSTFAGR